VVLRTNADPNLLRFAIDNTAGFAPDPDADIISGLKAGDKTALSTLMERHMSVIYNQAYYMLGDQMAAEDITQTVFMKTWQNIGKWQMGQAKLLTWMRRVTTNACLDQLRKKKPIYSNVVPDIQDTADTPFEALSRQNQSDIIKAALQKLSDKQRAAVTLSYYQGLSQREGAAVMDISEGAYESLLVRGRKALKTLLKKNMMEI